MTPFQRLGVLLTAEAIAALEQAVPARCMRRDETVEEHLRYAGQRELVEVLRSKFEEAQANILSPFENNDDV